MPTYARIYGVLTTTAAITAVTTRIYPTQAPQGAATPYIVYTQISRAPHNALSGYVGSATVGIQIDIFSSSYEPARGLSTSIHTALGNATAFSALLVGERDDYDDVARLYRVSQDYSLIDIN